MPDSIQKRDAKSSMEANARGKYYWNRSSKTINMGNTSKCNVINNESKNRLGKTNCVSENKIILSSFSFETDFTAKKIA